jgi:hypothetical protein
MSAEFGSDVAVDVADTLDLLNKHGIPTDKWGIGGAKSVVSLQREINSGETTLVTSTNGELIRKVIVASADIYYNGPDGSRYKLVESQQVFSNGATRIRNQRRSVSEKIVKGEKPIDAIHRGILEELGINVDTITIQFTETELEEINSPSYPGLKSQYQTYGYQVYLTDDQYNPDGYIETQKDKTTYFYWVD